jgi:hypothetical protein
VIGTVVQYLVPPLFAASLAFYGIVFWHWRNDGKQRDARRKNSARAAADASGFGSWLD